MRGINVLRRSSHHRTPTTLEELVALVTSRPPAALGEKITNWICGVDRTRYMTIDGSSNISDWGDAISGAALLSQSSTTKRPAGSTTNGGTFDGTDDALFSATRSDLSMDTFKTILYCMVLSVNATESYAGGIASDSPFSHFFMLRKKANTFGTDINPGGAAGGVSTGVATSTTRRACIMRRRGNNSTIQVYGKSALSVSCSVDTASSNRFLLGALSTAGLNAGSCVIQAAYVFEGGSTTDQDNDLFAWAVAQHGSVAAP